MLRPLGTSLTIVISLLGLLAPDGLGATPAKPRRVLVLYSHRYALPINQQWERGIREGIEAQVRKQVAIDNEHIDLQRLKSDDDRQGLMDLLRLKYDAIKPDVVIPVDDAAAEIFLRRDPFPDAPIVFCSIQADRRRLCAGRAVPAEQFHPLQQFLAGPQRRNPHRAARCLAADFAFRKRAGLRTL